MQKLLHLDTSILADQVRLALTEDVGSGDASAALLPAEKQFSAHIISREHMVLCGQAWANEVFAQLSNQVNIEWQVTDGDLLEADQQVCTLQGPAHALLTGERTALNFLQLLSGTATLARRYADSVKGFDVRLLDTRKTIPGLRTAQKYAVRCGGCDNHRMGLYDAIMLKENHLAAGDSMASLITKARQQSPDIPIIVEAEFMHQVPEAVDAGADRVLLDNFSLVQLRQAVDQYGQHIRLEASGGINLKTIRDVAATGVHDISIGELSKHLQAADFSMRYR